MTNIKVPIKCDCGCGRKVGYVTCAPEEREKWEKHNFGTLLNGCCKRLKNAAKLKADTDRHFMEEAIEAVISGEATETQRRRVFGKMLSNP